MVTITSSVLLGYAKSAVVFIATLIVLAGVIGYILRKTRSPTPTPTKPAQQPVRPLYPGTGIPVSDAEAEYYATNPYYYSDPFSLWYYYDWIYDPWWYYGSGRRHHHYNNNHHDKPKPTEPTTTTQPPPSPTEPVSILPTEPVSILPTEPAILPTEPVSILPTEPALIPTEPSILPTEPVSILPTEPALIPSEPAILPTDIPLIQDLANQSSIPTVSQIINTPIPDIPQPPPVMNSVPQMQQPPVMNSIAPVAVESPPLIKEVVTEGFTGGMDSPSSCYLKQAWNSGLYVRGGRFIPAANTYGDKWESANWGPK